MAEGNSDYKFSLWCFGDVWDEFLLGQKDAIDLMQAWNHRHGDLLLLHEHDCVSKSMDKMKELWKQRNKNKKKRIDDVALPKDFGVIR